MTPINKLWDLRENVKFWQYKFDTSYPHNAKEMLDKLTIAKQHLKNHKLKYFPELLDQPKRDYIPYKMLADKFEVFENYLND
jgi:hypothetical protein